MHAWNRFDKLVPVATRLVSAAKAMSVPLIVTEQYPQKLGATVPAIGIGDTTAYPKTKFSMVIPEVSQAL